MRTTNSKRAIRGAFYRLGLHSTPDGVLDALQKHGVHVTEELVRQVRFEMVKRRKSTTRFRRRRPGIRRRRPRPRARPSRNLQTGQWKATPTSPPVKTLARR